MRRVRASSSRLRREAAGNVSVGRTGRARGASRGWDVRHRRFQLQVQPLYRELRVRVRSGAIGNVRVVRTIFSSPRRATTGWRESRGKGGGVLLELGSHHADLIRWLTGAEAATIQCLVTGGDNASQCTSVHLGLDSGASAQMLVAFGYNRRGSRRGDWRRRRDTCQSLSFSHARGERRRRAGTNRYGQGTLAIVGTSPLPLGEDGVAMARAVARYGARPLRRSGIQPPPATWPK